MKTFAMRRPAAVTTTTALILWTCLCHEATAQEDNYANEINNQDESLQEQGRSILSNVIFYVISLIASLSAIHLLMMIYKGCKHWWIHRNDVPPPPPKTVEERKEDLREIFIKLNLTRTFEEGNASASKSESGDESEDVELGRKSPNAVMILGDLESNGTIQEARASNINLDNDSDEDICVGLSSNNAASIFRRVPESVAGNDTDESYRDGNGDVELGENSHADTDFEKRRDDLNDDNLQSIGGFESKGRVHTADTIDTFRENEGPTCAKNSESQPKQGPTDDNEDAMSLLLDDSNLCAICLEPYEAGDVVVHSNNPGCPHEFHRDCVLDYFCKFDDGTTPCPFCRQTFCCVPSIKGDEEERAEIAPTPTATE